MAHLAMHCIMESGGDLPRALRAFCKLVGAGSTQNVRWALITAIQDAVHGQYEGMARFAASPADPIGDGYMSAAIVFAALSVAPTGRPAFAQTLAGLSASAAGKNLIRFAHAALAGLRQRIAPASWDEPTLEYL
jgi:hypothetical protein